MTEAELARAVAAELAAELGPAVVEETNREIAGEPAPGGQKRAFGVGEAMAVAGFLVSCAQLVTQIWQARQDRALLVLALAEGLDKDPRLAARLDPERRLGLIARIVNRLVPDRFGRVPGAAAEADQKKWIADWLELGRRRASVPILRPFAGMEYYSLHEPLYWDRASTAPLHLPASITVPKGFVTDLATVPRVFWALMPPAGEYGLAAIIHDWLYWNQTSSRAIADDVFLAIMEEMSVDPLKRRIMWAAVRVFGGMFWDEDKLLRKSGERRILKAVPAVADVTWEQWRQRPGVFADEDC